VLALKSLKGILVVGERNIFIELAQIVDIATEANELVSKMFKMDYKENELTQLLHEVQLLEKKSDEIAFKISEDITGGAISPNILDNLLECVQMADDIVDTYYYVGREINRMARAYSSGFQKNETNWDTVYENMLALAEKSLSKLKQALSSSKIAEILEMRKEIEALEEQGDDVKDAGFDRLYRITSKLQYLEFYHYSELLHKCDNVLDYCEDLSDLIVAVVSSILK
jgi:predicted phosphate transport protein (TIGR00153 family)